MPKSPSLTAPSSLLTSRLPVLTSRCRMPAAWMAAKALARPKAILATWGHDGRQPCEVLNAQHCHETHVNVSSKIVCCSALRGIPDLCLKQCRRDSPADAACVPNCRLPAPSQACNLHNTLAACCRAHGMCSRHTADEVLMEQLVCKCPGIAGMQQTADCCMHGMHNKVQHAATVL